MTVWACAVIYFNFSKARPDTYRMTESPIDYTTTFMQLLVKTDSAAPDPSAGRISVVGFIRAGCRGEDRG